MTDNRHDAQTQKPAQQQPADAQTTTTRPQTATTANNQTAEAKKPAASAKPTKAPEPQVKKVDIAITGVNYNIFCPVHEEEELRSAVHYINSFAQDIKKNAPGLSQENLLVLTCLNLYEKIHAHKKTDDDQRHQSEQADALLSKVMKDAQSIL